VRRNPWYRLHSTWWKQVFNIGKSTALVSYCWTKRDFFPLANLERQLFQDDSVIVCGRGKPYARVPYVTPSAEGVRADGTQLAAAVVDKRAFYNRRFSVFRRDQWKCSEARAHLFPRPLYRAVADHACAESEKHGHNERGARTHAYADGTAAAVVGALRFPWRFAGIYKPTDAIRRPSAAAPAERKHHGLVLLPSCLLRSCAYKVIATCVPKIYTRVTHKHTHTHTHTHTYTHTHKHPHVRKYAFAHAYT
jgi:hypothetical protein